MCPYCSNNGKYGKCVKLRRSGMSEADSEATQMFLCSVVLVNGFQLFTKFLQKSSS